MINKYMKIFMAPDAGSGNEDSEPSRVVVKPRTTIAQKLRAAFGTTGRTIAANLRQHNSNSGQTVAVALGESENADIVPGDIQEGEPLVELPSGQS